MVATDVDGAAEERTPFIPARGMRRIVFTPRPSGFRFYHTHNRAGADLHAGQYSGQVGPVYIELNHEPGSYDREVFLVLKEFEPSFSQGGDMVQDFLSPTTRVKELETSGEFTMKTSLAKGMPILSYAWALLGTLGNPGPFILDSEFQKLPSGEVFPSWQ